MAPDIGPRSTKTSAQSKRPDFIEGGDILTTETEILVGTSGPHHIGGIEGRCRRATVDWGYTVREVTTPCGRTALQD
jgi:dimethylargininase